MAIAVVLTNAQTGLDEEFIPRDGWTIQLEFGPINTPGVTMLNVYTGELIRVRECFEDVSMRLLVAQRPWVSFGVKP